MAAARSSSPLKPPAPLPEGMLGAIAAAGVVRAFPRNSVLINEGDSGDSLYIILAGKVKVYASNVAGKEVVIDFHGPGEYVGEMSLAGAPRSASVITVEPTTCAIVTRAHFREFIRAQPDFALHLIEKLIHRARLDEVEREIGLRPDELATENVKSLALSDVYGRVVRLLVTLARDVDGTQVVPERLTQQDIADRVGASRDMISRLLKDLVAGGYLAIEDRTITILKKPPPGW
jgi:CRP/FNR family cyclic AMP-dependent transcriptional regulator